MLRRALLAAVLVAIAAAPADAQTASNTIRYSGRILGVDGAPLANVPVRFDVVYPEFLRTPLTIAEHIEFGDLSYKSCYVAGGACPAGRVSGVVHTDAAGEYHLVSGDVGSNRGTVTATAAIPSRRRRATLVVSASVRWPRPGEVRLPDLAAWDPAIALSSTPTGYPARYDPRPNSVHIARVVDGPRLKRPGDTAPQAPVERIDTPTTEVDARRVEDATFGVVVTALAPGQTFAAVVWAKGREVPLSRHARCVARLDGAATESCSALTDGDLNTSPYSEFRVDLPRVEDVTIDLGVPRSVGAVRAVVASVPAAGSLDAKSWKDLPVTEFAPQRLRYVRVAGDGRFAPELSVWPPRAAALLRPPVAAPEPILATSAGRRAQRKLASDDPEVMIAILALGTGVWLIVARIRKSTALY